MRSAAEHWWAGVQEQGLAERAAAGSVRAKFP
jgi:hypothetical protein